MENIKGYATRSTRQLAAPSASRHDKRTNSEMGKSVEEDTESIIRALQKSLNERDAECAKERHRYRSLEGTTKRLKLRLSDLEKSDIRYNAILDDVLIPYAGYKNLRIDIHTGELIDNIGEPLLQDALKATGMQNEAQGWREQYHKLEYEADILREQVRVLVAQKKQFRHDLRNNGVIPDLEQQIQAQRNENEALHEQIQDLQKDALTRVENIEFVSDDQFEKEFQAIASSVKALSRLIRLVDQVDVVQELPSGMFLLNVDPVHWHGSARKKIFIEAWIWAALVIYIFRSPFSVFGDNANGLGETWKRIFGNEHVNDWPAPSSLCEQWRCTTAKKLRELGSNHVNPDQNGEPWAKRARHLDSLPSENLALTLDTHLMRVAVGSNIEQLRNIADKAFALASQMSHQRNRLQLTYPEAGAMFQANEMSAVPDRDSENGDAGLVAFVVNPGLTKWGNARGEDLEQRFDIVPSLVQLEPVQIKQEPGSAEHHEAPVASDSTISQETGNANQLVHNPDVQQPNNTVHGVVVKQEPICL
ncbi:hypothetical protein T440DRAFT_532756 [Plenodomus tracheiphilus IPT5]|uniref:Uncharacterized protein n=1 Tax=Plenodomus tracheiphilus IPT5 TaxID=1408161 RepID=A0A6A7B3H0_9PLEO|nr:hypothetical protein T440DRAFT_532756 [Plenodomus tracheiphilus IPT5]